MQHSKGFNLEEEYKKYKNVLKGAKEGEVVTRFPPEPSGYLHIGHAKAALINYHYSQIYKGKMIFRIDDTNVEKEKDEYVNSIIEDLKTLGVKWHGDITHTSDYFDYLIEKAEELIKEGKAYCDPTPVDQMRDERLKMVESTYRSTTPEENLKIFRAMCQGPIDGVEEVKNADDYCLRAKIDMKSPNGSLRDPVLFRVNVKPHHRTGTKYRCYPTYDFCCPLVDSKEGVTHAMRSNEYSDRIPQYNWVLQACKVRPVTIFEFSRLNLQFTLLSKRKLQEFVDKAVVEGWDDPRFPTVKGIIRKGLTVEALTEFMLAQGPSKNTNLMEWDKIWSINKSIIDPLSGRFSALSSKNLSTVEVTNVPAGHVEPVETPLHPKEDLGKKIIFQASKLLIDYEDAAALEKDQIVTFMKWGNFKILEVVKPEAGPVSVKAEYLPDNKDFKKTVKLNWIADVDTVKLILVEYDHLLREKKLLDEKEMAFEKQLNEVTKYVTDAIGETALKDVKLHQYVQLERRGYYKVDKIHEIDGKKVPELIYVPDGKTKPVGK
ncbi:hypothetical protein ABPG74_013963 [Tetrahymena malaccensis]